MHPVTALTNGGIGNGIMDGSGTINPAALNSSGTYLAQFYRLIVIAMGEQGSFTNQTPGLKSAGIHYRYIAVSSRSSKLC